MPSSSRYFATVRRAMVRPCPCSAWAISWSESAAATSSASTMSLIIFFTDTDDTIDPLIGHDAAVEEVLELEQALRGLHVLVRGDAADGRLVHVDVVADVAQRERAQEGQALVEEVALEVHEALGHAPQRALALLHALDQPHRASGSSARHIASPRPPSGAGASGTASSRGAAGSPPRSGRPRSRRRPSGCVTSGTM